jgi:small ligand-binding sensory domain FIST
MTPRAVTDFCQGGFDENRTREMAEKLRSELGEPVTLGLVFFTPDYAKRLEDFLETLRLYGHIPMLVGCSASSLVANGTEIENEQGFVLQLMALPDCQITPFVLRNSLIEEGADPGFWRTECGVPHHDGLKAWFVFADPFSCSAETWLKMWNEAYPGVPTFGGLAGGVPQQPEAWVIFDNRIVEGIAFSISGNYDVKPVVSQGCRPIGEPLTITDAQRNILIRLGRKPAYQVLNEAFQSLSLKEREHAQGHLFAGLAVSEYIDDYKVGDFLIRNIIGADPAAGAVALSAFPRVGQTLQYHLRDHAAASAELHSLLNRTQIAISALERKPVAGILCTCNGRGRTLFGQAHHDAGAVQKHFPNLPVAGFFANGEIGPVGDRNFIHGYTASLALISKI